MQARVLFAVRVLSRLFRRLFLAGSMVSYRAGKLTFFGDLNDPTDKKAFAAWRAPVRKTE